MAFVTLNAYQVQHASSLLVYENLFPAIQHINGKGVTDTWTKTDDVRNVTFIDVMRVLPYAPRFRRLGASNNGTWHNQNNVGGVNNAPQAVKYTIPVDLWYDEGVPITSPQIYSNPVTLKQVVMKQLINVMALTINIITYAKQLQAFFLDSFADPANPTATELAEAVFPYDGALEAKLANSAADAFIAANAQLTEGCLELGAFHIPMEERQAFITTGFDRILKRQYMQNASEASARILANGFLNPFTATAGVRINSATGLLGMYDGVDMFLFNSVTQRFVRVALGVPDNTSDATKIAVIALLKQIGGFVVYGEGTVRGVAFQDLEVNKHPFQGGVYIVPQMKIGVEVLNGKTIKMMVNAGTNLAQAWTLANITSIAQTIAFTEIDGVAIKGEVVFNAGLFNDGTSS